LVLSKEFKELAKKVVINQLNQDRLMKEIDKELDIPNQDDLDKKFKLGFLEGMLYTEYIVKYNYDSVMKPEERLVLRAIVETTMLEFEQHLVMPSKSLGDCFGKGFKNGRIIWN